MKINSINTYNLVQQTNKQTNKQLNSNPNFKNINFQGNENRRKIGKIAATTALIAAPIVSPACIYCKKPIEKDTYATKIEHVSYDNNIDSSRKRAIIINTNEVSEEQLKDEKRKVVIFGLVFLLVALAGLEVYEVMDHS